MTPKTMNTIDSVISRAKFRGSHFFDKDTMRAFGSRLADDVYPDRIGAGTYFMTSERDRDRGYGAAWNGQRRYTVRYLDSEGEFHDASEFGEFSSLPAARRIARWLQVKGHRTCRYYETVCAHDLDSTQPRYGSVAAMDEAENG
jgi:hypothetical protein